VVHSLVTGAPRRIQVTVANAGLIDNLPAGAGVEVPCTLGADGVHPQPVGSLPDQCAALNRSFLSVVGLTVEAAVQGRPELVRHALMVDPNTAATLDVDAIWRCADAMVAAHGDLLPEPLRAPLAT
jgi:alpha-galactosidase